MLVFLGKLQIIPKFRYFFNVKKFKKLSSTREVNNRRLFQILLENKLAKIKSLMLKDYVHLVQKKNFMNINIGKITFYNGQN